MAMGIVKWFNNTKGYGFIAPEEGEDLFVHYSSIQIEGYRTLKGGQRVAFEVQKGDKGAHAISAVGGRWYPIRSLGCYREDVRQTAICHEQR